jgi:hypothetical protein
MELVRRRRCRCRRRKPGAALTSILSSAAPLTRSQLIGLPFWAALLGAMSAGFFFRLLGPTLAAALALLLASTMGTLAAWIAYRSDFAARHGLVGTALMSLLLASLLAGSAVLTVSMLGAPSLASWAVGSCIATTLLSLAGGAWRRWTVLRGEGFDGPWVQAHVDNAAGRLRAGALTAVARDAGRGAFWAVAALAVNVPLFYRSLSISDAQAMPWVLLLLAGTTIWIGLRWIGPMGATSLFLLQLEAASGRRLRHEQDEALQALRRSFVISRWCMRDDGADRAPGFSEAAPSPPPRRRRKP